MKKILIILIAIFVLCSCSKKIDEEVITHKEEINVWDIEPVYEYDNIDVDFAMLNHYADGSFDDCEFIVNN